MEDVGDYDCFGDEGDAGMWMMSILVIRPTLSVFS